MATFKRWNDRSRRILASGMALFLAGLPGWAADPVLIWADEFEVEGLPDSSRWLYDVGGDGWGNGEAQFYTQARLENARVEGGLLVLEARKEPWPVGRNATHEYTSARLVSKGSGDWLYGRIEVRAKLPAGRGTWPAIWMLPTGNAYGGWPRSGEIDIMEHVGFAMGTVHGSLHSIEHNWTTGTQPTGSTTVADIDTTFHVYAIEWSPSAIRFLIDGSEFFSATNPGTGWEAWPYDQPFHLILNLAVGGFWGGQEGIDPDIWPARLEVDYVRVYDLGDTPVLDTDRDGDPNATDPDDDGDGLTDAAEHDLGTNLLEADTDGDGYTDFEEVEAATSPLLSGSYPGSDRSILMVNNDFMVGDDPWIVHTNRLDASGNWIGQAGSWGGAYAVSDYVVLMGEEAIVFSNYTEGDAPNAEHLLYQEWKASLIDLAAGDVIRFRGVAQSAASAEGISAQAFIRVLDGAFQKLPASVEVNVGPEAGAFELETTIGADLVNVLQVGLAITAPQAETASITFHGLEATRNEDAYWAGWAVENGWVDTGSWLGEMHVEHAPWIWSGRLQNWIFVREEWIRPRGGSWVYVHR